MSLLEDKKAMLKKLAKQKAMYQKTIFKIPKISSKEEFPKTFIPNIKSIEKKTNEEDKMRKFLSDVLEIQVDDFIMSDDEDVSIFSYNNKIVDNGYKLYIQSRSIDMIYEDEDMDRFDVIIKVIKEWNKESMITKLIWVIKAFANKEWSKEVSKHRSNDLQKLETELAKLNKQNSKKLSSKVDSIDDSIKHLQDEIAKLNKKETNKIQKVGWGAKKFADDIELYIKNESVLKTFIEDYLNSNKSYDIFVKHWLRSSKGGFYTELAEQEDLEEIENEQTDNRLPITEKEQELINDLKQRLAGYEEAFIKLEEKIKIKEQLLNDLSNEQLVEIASPITERKNNEELIKYIVRNESQSEESPSEEKEKAEKLSNISRQDLIKMATDQKSAPTLVKMITEEEFARSRKKLKNKMSTLSIEIHNLNLGRYVSVPEKEKKLSYKERKYRELLVVYIRKLEVQLWSYIKLALHASNIKAPKSSNKEKLIDSILKVEFPNVVQSELKNISRTQMSNVLNTLNDDQLYVLAKEYNIGNIDNRSRDNIIDSILSLELKKISRTQMSNVLNTLNDDQLYVLAKEYNIGNIDNRSRDNIIDSILSLEYKKVKQKTRQAVMGRNVSNWSREERKIELDKLNYKNLIEIAYIYGIKLSENETDMVIKILNYEERVASLISTEDAEKEKIIEKIIEKTGESFSSYSVWSIEELNKKIKELNDENYGYTREKEQLLKKLSGIVDIKSDKYKNVKSWSIKKLVKTLKKVGGIDLERQSSIPSGDIPIPSGDIPIPSGDMPVENYAFVKCIREYKLFKWINGKVTGIWLESPVSKEAFDTYSEYIFPDIFIEENGKSWYQANNKYFELHCNKYKNYRIQDGDILTCFTNEKTELNFKVGYTVTGSTEGNTHTVTQMVSEIRYDDDHKPIKTMIPKTVKRTFIIQDEAMFKKEKEESKKSNQSDEYKANELLNSYVTEKSKQLVAQTISKALKEIAPMKNDYGIININTKIIDFNTPYMQVLMNNLVTNAEQTNRELFTKAADILVYLTIPEAKTFRHNIEMEYYVPDILARLSPAEKFPEAFEQVINGSNSKLLSKKCVIDGDDIKCTMQAKDEVSDKYINYTTSIINNKIMKIVNYLGLKSIHNPLHKNVTTIYENSYFSIKTYKRISACANKNRVLKANPEEIVYYKEKDSIYCFTVDELYNQFINGNFTNPETDIQFNTAFVQRFNELYNKKLVEDGFLTTHFQEKYGFDMKELINDKKEEDVILMSPIIAANFWDIIANDVKELENQLSNEEDDDENKDREVERRDDEVEKGICENRQISVEDACEYCKKHLMDDSIKTIIRHGDENKIIKFCSFACFENKNDWKKPPKKKKTKKQVQEVEPPKKKKTKKEVQEEPPKKKKTKKQVQEVEPPKKKKTKKEVQEEPPKKKKTKKQVQEEEEEEEEPPKKKKTKNKNHLRKRILRIS